VLAACAFALVVAGLLVLGHRGGHAVRRSAAQPGSEAELVSMLGVLRRPQSAAERAIVELSKNPRNAIGDIPDPDSVRIVGPGLIHGRDVFVFLSPSAPGPPGQPASGPAAVCIYYPDIEGGGVGCQTAAQIRQHGTDGSLGVLTYNVVPDGVAEVELSFPGGVQRSAPVHDNFWQVQPPAGPSGPLGSGAIGQQPTAVVWKDAAGRVIGPSRATLEARAAARAGVALRNAPRPVELHRPVAVLPGDRIRFTPQASGHRFEILLRCPSGSGFSGGITAPLPGGRPATVRLHNLSIARRGPSHCGEAFVGDVEDLGVSLRAPAKGPVILGQFRIRVP
jgi:hypothetical protein